MLSAVIITYNEERNIERCINSLKPVVEEIIVIDSYSSDNTRNICESLNVKFHQIKWRGYSETKNYGHELAEHPYILSIDADESLSDELQNSIVKLRKKGMEACYSFNRLSNYCGNWVKHCGWYPDVKVRIFPKQVKWKGEIHEELQLKGMEIIHLKGDLYHYTYYNHKEHKDRADKYSVLTAQKMFEKGKKAGWLKPELSAFFKFISIYFFKLGFADGKAGWHIARISAASNKVKYKTLRHLIRENK